MYRTAGGNKENSVISCFHQTSLGGVTAHRLKKVALHHLTDRHLLINVDNADINVLPNEMLTEFHLE